MSDRKLRELDRRWQETRSVDDEAAYLRERVRVGDLALERLELAAYCGHAAAQQCAPRELPDSPELWLVGIKAFGQEAWVRALTARHALRGADLDKLVLRYYSRWLAAASSEERDRIFHTDLPLDEEDVVRPFLWPLGSDWQHQLVLGRIEPSRASEVASQFNAAGAIIEARAAGEDQVDLVLHDFGSSAYIPFLLVFQRTFGLGLQESREFLERPGGLFDLRAGIGGGAIKPLELAQIRSSLIEWALGA